MRSGEPGAVLSTGLRIAKPVSVFVCGMNNIAALDELCLAHLEESASHKCVDNVCVHDTNSSAFSVSATLKRIRELVLNGQLQEALKLANAIAPGALEYPNFQLNLRLHQVDELVRSAALREPKRTSALTTDEHTLGAMKKLLPTYDDALQYVQSVVAPYAQEAFPEAVSHYYVWSLWELLLESSQVV